MPCPEHGIAEITGNTRQDLACAKTQAGINQWNQFSTNYLKRTLADLVVSG
jgi:hypothetical protein